MNSETLGRANELTRLISEKEKVLSVLTYKVGQRKRYIRDYKGSSGLCRWIPFEKWFCVGTIKKKNGSEIVFDAPIECEYPLDFELDEECVDFIIKHEMETIQKLKAELDAL